MASLAESKFAFTRLPHPAPTPADVRQRVLEAPGFGTHFSDHMITIDWTDGVGDGKSGGWHDATIGPRGPIALDPAAAVLHYAQEIFEGLKAYIQADGSVALF